MKLSFDSNNVTVTEFGVGQDNGDEYVFALVPVNADVQTALCDMAEETCHAMRQHSEGAIQYEPSEKYDSTEYLYLATDDPMAVSLRNLHDSENLPIQSSALADPHSISCYFARLTDNQGRRLTALRRATQFKGVLKKKLVQIADDTLQLVEDKIFKLDNDFDLLIDSENVHILRPSAFEAMGKLKEAILAAMPPNVNHIQQSIPFVNFGNVRDYASQRPRAARYLASIRTQNLRGIERSALQTLCEKSGVELEVNNGKLMVNEKYILDFLEVLDRRRYVDELDPNTPAPYKATSRQKIVP